LHALDPDAARVTDKMPSNFLYLSFIALLFPNARIVHCRRDPRDVGLSCYFQNFSHRPAFAYDLGDIGFYTQEYERLMAHWQAVAPLSILDIDYEALIADQEGESRRLVESSGLNWGDACLVFHKSDRAVRAASSGQVRQPLYASSAGRWHNYESHVAPLLEVLEDDRSQPRQDEGEEALDESIRRAPDDPAPCHRLGQLRRRQGRPEEAIACFDAAIERYPDYLGALISLATLREARGESEAAVALYRRALEIDASGYAALVNLTNILAERGDPNEGAMIYRKAIATRKAPVEALVDFGNLLTRQGYFKEAAACYEQALGSNPKHAVVHNIPANLLKENNK
jgi:tetratricopeptide (TPR) repeat protein